MESIERRQRKSTVRQESITRPSSSHTFTVATQKTYLQYNVDNSIPPSHEFLNLASEIYADALDKEGTTYLFPQKSLGLVDCVNGLLLTIITVLPETSSVRTPTMSVRASRHLPSRSTSRKRKHCKYTLVPASHSTHSAPYRPWHSC
jgi:hypothetical protein